MWKQSFLKKDPCERDVIYVTHFFFFFFLNHSSKSGVSQTEISITFFFKISVRKWELLRYSIVNSSPGPPVARLLLPLATCLPQLFVGWGTCCWNRDEKGEEEDEEAEEEASRGEIHWNADSGALNLEPGLGSCCWRGGEGRRWRCLGRRRRRGLRGVWRRKMQSGRLPLPRCWQGVFGPTPWSLLALRTAPRPWARARRSISALSLALSPRRSSRLSVLWWGRCHHD